jgi:hypothetical protein
MRWAVQVARLGKWEIYKLLVRKSEGIDHLRTRRRWKAILGCILKEIWWEGVDWIQLAARDRNQW